MKIPQTIKIGWRTYEIKMVEERRDEEGELLSGQIDLENHIIYIDNNLDNDEKAVAFLHELTHGIFNSHCHSDWRDNEDLVESVSEGLYQVMKDNPKIFT